MPAPEPLSQAEAIAMGRPAIAGQTVYRSQGCLYCAGRGFSGRVGLFECMAPDVEIAGLIEGGCSEAQLLSALRRKGFRTLIDDAVIKVLQGVSTVSEVLELTAEF
jgi:type II secretory ATPase GspE/PulE/Tfp pilus assembly ATPase PilB-like protein